MKDFKIGDKVKLDESTKPYGFISLNGNKKQTDGLKDNEIYEVYHIYSDGDIDIISIDTRNVSSVNRKHLKHVEEEVNQLRLDIFKTNPSLSVGEMQDIEKWLLNK